MKKMKYSEALKLLTEFLQKKYPEFSKHPEFMACVTHFLQNPQIRPPFMNEEMHEDSLEFVSRMFCKNINKWFEQPYIEYLNAVDNVLEKRSGTTSLQEELSFIAESQEMNLRPNETAKEILEGRKR